MEEINTCPGDLKMRRCFDAVDMRVQAIEDSVRLPRGEVIPT